MAIKKKPFRRYNEEKKNDTFTVWLNDQEREVLDKAKKIIEQPKDSTALKQLAWIGAKIIGRPEMSYVLGTIFSNKRKNERLGIVEFE